MTTTPAASPAAPPPPPEPVSAVTRLKLDSEWLERRAVTLARSEGYDWGRISRLLQISWQAARQRFAKAEGGGMLPTTQRRSYRDPIVDERLDNASQDHWRREMKRLEDSDDAVMW